MFKLFYLPSVLVRKVEYKWGICLWTGDPQRLKGGGYCSSVPSLPLIFLLCVPLEMFAMAPLFIFPTHLLTYLFSISLLGRPYPTLSPTHLFLFLSPIFKFLPFTFFVPFPSSFILLFSYIIGGFFFSLSVFPLMLFQHMTAGKRIKSLTMECLLKEMMM